MTQQTESLVRLRPIEKTDLAALLRAEQAWNTRDVVDEDFGQLRVLNPWALTAKHILETVRSRKDNEKGSYDTRTFVAERIVHVHGVEKTEVCGAIAYEKQADAFEVIYTIIHPRVNLQEILGEMIWYIKLLADRSNQRKRVVVWLRDRDEAGLRLVMPIWQAAGFTFKLVPDKFAGCDGWKGEYFSCSWIEE